MKQQQEDCPAGSRFKRTTETSFSRTRSPAQICSRHSHLSPSLLLLLVPRGRRAPPQELGTVFYYASFLKWLETGFNSQTTQRLVG